MSERRGLADRAVVALLVHAASSFFRAIEGVWFTADLWFVRDLTHNEDIPVAAGAVGPPALLSIIAMLLSVGATLYAALVLALWAQAKARKPVRDRKPYFIAGAWVATLVVCMLPSALLRGDVLDSARAAFRVSYWAAASSIGMLAADLSLAEIAATRLRRLREG